LKWSKKSRAAGQEFDLAMNLWGTAIGTSLELKLTTSQRNESSLRKLVLDWNRAEKKAPSDELSAAYKAYLSTFPEEADMTVWSAQVGRERKEFANAVALYSRGAQLYSAIRKSAVKAEDKKGAVEGLENALLGAIETAEISKDNVLLVSAYDSYLTLSLDKKREVEVLYQKATSPTKNRIILPRPSKCERSHS
jgi:hypothetical protein